MNYCYPKGTHFALFGSKTLDSQRIYIQFSNYYVVDCFLSMDVVSQTNIWNHLANYNIDEYLANIRKEDTIILIALRRTEPWKEYVDYLKSKGLKFFDDFNLFFLMDDLSLDLATLISLEPDEQQCGELMKKFAAEKKLYFINGNCQASLLQLYLNANKVFSDRYYYIELPRIHHIDKSGELLYKIALKYADLCLSQPINTNNRFSAILSSEYLQKNLNQHSKFLLFPKLHFSGYFPQFKKKQDNALMFGIQSIFAYGDKYIDEMLKAGNSYEKISKTILDPDFLSKDFVMEYFNSQLEEFKSDEKDCDVKMYDYVNYFAKKEILWNAFNHPVNKVIKELSIRIMLKLGMTREECNAFIDIEEIDGSDLMRNQMQIVYPSVYNALDIKRQNELYRINKNASNILVNEEDYIRMYCNSYIVPAR